MHRPSVLDRPWVKSILLCALVGLVYWNSLENPFEFDDWHVIPDNPAIKGLDRIPSFFIDLTPFSILQGNRDYRPLFLTSMALCWWAGGGSTVPFHVVSVLLHMGTSVLLFLTVREVQRWPGERAGPPASELAAFLSAALFAVHPLATETVNYISSQSVGIAAFFYLLSFHLLVRLSRRATEAGGRLRASIVSCVPYVLALLAKPIAITLPAIVFIWSWIFGSRSDPVAPGARFPGRLVRALTTVAPHVLVSLLYLAARRAVGASAAGNLLSDRQDTAHVMSWYLTQTKALVFYYLKLAFVPIGLSVDREYPLATSLEGPVFLALLTLLGFAVVLYRCRHNRTLVFWSLWFPVCLFVTTYATVLGQVVNEHRVYLSLVGFCAVVGTLTARLWTGASLRVWDTHVGPRTGRLVGGALILVLVTFALMTRAQNRVWASGLTLWENAAQNDGTWRAHMNYGLALEEAGRPDEALRELEQAVEMAPYAWAHMNLGLAYTRREDLERGLDHLRTAVRLWPDLPEGHLYLGWALERAGRVDEAASELRRALELRPDYVKGHEYLGALQARRGDTEAAIASYRLVLEIDPSREWVHREIRRLRGGSNGTGGPDAWAGLAAIDAGNFEGARERLLRAHAHDPTDVAVLFGLAYAHQRLGQSDEAQRLYEELIRLDSHHRQGTFNLAYAYRDQTTREKLSRSAELFRTVLELDPEYDEALHHLATVLWKLDDAPAARRCDSLYVKSASDPGLKELSIRRLRRPS